MIVTDAMLEAQQERITKSIEEVSALADDVLAEHGRMRAVLAELEGELDRQLYNDEYVRQCHNNDLDIPNDSEHHVIITQKMWRKIQDAAKIAARR